MVPQTLISQTTDVVATTNGGVAETNTVAKIAALIEGIGDAMHRHQVKGRSHRR